MSIHLFNKKKSSGQKITMLTCYDYWTAKILSASDIDTLLIGDSGAMVMHGHNSTVTATMEMMCFHTKAVSTGAPNKFIVADLPFGTYRMSKEDATKASVQLMQAGAHAVKLEGLKGHEDIVNHLVGSGIPVMGHLGLTPQSVNSLGGYKVQGRDLDAAEQIMKDALELEARGSFCIVLECVPSSLAQKITNELKVPTIGIGAGLDCDGQVLVLQDMLGGQSDLNPKFVRKFANLNQMILDAANQYCKEVTEKSFPNIQESYE